MKMLGNRGDTIVEVLLAMGILAAVLGGGYVTANRAQLANQAAQERSEALKVVESQVEGLKSFIASSKTLPAAGTVFCIKQDFSDAEAITAPGNPFAESLETATLPYQPADCGGIGPANRYNIALRDIGGTYELLVRWERIGNGWDQLNMYYRP